MNKLQIDHPIGLCELHQQYKKTSYLGLSERIIERKRMRLAEASTSYLSIPLAPNWASVVSGLLAHSHHW